MAGVSFRIDVNDRGIQAALSRLVRAERDLTRPMDDIGSMLHAATIRRFELGIGPDGTPWPPSQRAAARGGLTLVDTGRLRGSITWRPGPDGVDVGTNVIYARIHQLGGKTGRGHATELPARPYLGVDDGDRDEIVAILRDHLGQAARP